MTARIVRASFTRPADVTAYAAGDIINNSTSTPTFITFANAVPAPGVFGFIRNALATKTSIGTGSSTMRLFLFREPPATIANDNAPWTPAAADLLNVVGYIDYALYIAATGSAHSIGTCNPAAPIIFAPTGHRHLYGVLQALGAYTPASAEAFTLTLNIQLEWRGNP